MESHCLLMAILNQLVQMNRAGIAAGTRDLAGKSRWALYPPQPSTPYVDRHGRPQERTAGNMLTLQVASLAYDIAGVGILAWAAVFRGPREIAEQGGTHWNENKPLMNAFAENKIVSPGRGPQAGSSGARRARWASHGSTGVIG